MKILFSFFIFISHQSTAQKYTDIKNYGLKGTVKSLREEVFPASRSNNVLKVNEKKSLGYYFSYFDKFENTIKRSCDCIYGLNQKGIEEDIVIQNDSITIITKMSHKNEKIQTSIAIKKSEYFWIEEESFIDAPNTKTINTYYFNQFFRDSLKIFSHYTNGVLKEQNVIQYEYDENQFELYENELDRYFNKKGEFTWDWPTRTRYKILKKDEYGNWTEREVFNEKDKTKNVERRTFEYY